MTPASSMLAALEIGLNRYLALEPSVAEDLQRLSGRVLEVRLSDWDLVVQLAPADGRLQVLPAGASEPDAAISASAPAFARLMRASAAQRQTMFTSARVRVSGDTGLAQSIFACLKRVDFDPEDWLARVLGDMAGRRTATWLKGLTRWGRGTVGTLGRDVAEYLRDERREVVDREEGSQWMDAVDRLNDDTERLEARIVRLRQRLNER